MKVTKKIKIILIIIAVFTLPFIFYKAQGTNIYWINTYGGKVGDSGLDVFVIQNPPSSKEDLLKVIEKMNDTLEFKNRGNNNRCYIQKFYKETFNLTRYHEPYYSSSYTRHYYNIYTDDADFDPMIAIYRKEMDEKDNCIDAWYYTFNLKNDVSWEYYPKGFEDNPNIHWRKVGKIEKE